MTPTRKILGWIYYLLGVGSLVGAIVAGVANQLSLAVGTIALTFGFMALAEIQWFGKLR